MAIDRTVLLTHLGACARRYQVLINEGYACIHAFPSNRKHLMTSIELHKASLVEVNTMIANIRAGAQLS